MNALERGRMTLEEFHQLVDLTEKAVPGDERQHRFYEAIRELANKVDEVKPNPVKTG